MDWLNIPGTALMMIAGGVIATERRPILRWSIACVLAVSGLALVEYRA